MIDFKKLAKEEAKHSIELKDNMQTFKSGFFDPKNLDDDWGIEFYLNKEKNKKPPKKTSVNY